MEAPRVKGRRARPYWAIIRKIFMESEVGYERSEPNAMVVYGWRGRDPEGGWLAWKDWLGVFW